jgi:glycosyltransferase involved in cell wall biosynthesis
VLQKTLRILGTHGVPAGYGGFETAAENVAVYLANEGWRVIVYCQAEGISAPRADVWRGVERIFIATEKVGWRGTSDFDLKSTRHACRYRDPCLVFGYNTAIYNVLQRIHRVPLIINMDGIEWSRKRWGLPRQAILYINERIGAILGNQLIADHPIIEQHLQTRARSSKITTITYGGHRIESGDSSLLIEFGLEPWRYMSVICRPIPENTILELVRAFSSRRREHKLLILGEYDESDRYQKSVLQSASDEVIFIGSQFDTELVSTLRYFSSAYLHGHTVGGTNPSLVEAMGAGNAIIAHDNGYNRWVAGNGAVYFKDAKSAEDCIERVLGDDSFRTSLGEMASERFEEEFTWTKVAREYMVMLDAFFPPNYQTFIHGDSQ